MAATRLNRYLALAGLGTRRSVEGLVRAGRVAVDGVVALEPSAGVEPGASVTLDGEPVTADGPAGVLVALVDGAVPELAHPSALHLAGTSADGALAALISDERLARRLRALGYDPGRLGGAHPAERGIPPARPRRARCRPRSRTRRAARAGARAGRGPGTPCRLD